MHVSVYIFERRDFGVNLRFRLGKTKLRLGVVGSTPMNESHCKSNPKMHKPV